MNTLVLSDTNAEKYSEMENQALDKVIKFLKGDLDYGDEIKISIQGLNILSKNRQTLTARQCLRFAMVRASTDDPKLIKAFIDSTNPEMGKLLTGKT